MELCNFNVGSHACICARKHFVVREETSHEREEKRTHAVVRLRSVNGMPVGARHGGARTEQVRFSTNVRSGRIIVGAIIVGAGTAVVRMRDVMVREQRRHLL